MHGTGLHKYHHGEKGVFVCVCKRERERERGREGGIKHYMYVTWLQYTCHPKDKFLLVSPLPGSSMSWIVGSVTFLSEDTELAVHALRCISSSGLGTTVTKNKKTTKKMLVVHKFRKIRELYTCVKACSTYNDTYNGSSSVVAQRTAASLTRLASSLYLQKGSLLAAS